MFGRLLIVGALMLASGCGREPCSRASAGPAPPQPPVAHAAVGLRLESELGLVHCDLYPERTPRAVELVARLAEGTLPFVDPATRHVITRRYYDGLTFFRRIPGVLVQTGCPLDKGTGHPGFRIPAELHRDDRPLLEQAGALVMARYHPAPNRVDPHPPSPGHVIGSQWTIALQPMPHLAGKLPVIGRCRDLDVVRAIARAEQPPRLGRVDVRRSR